MSIETMKGNGGSYSYEGQVYTNTVRYVSELEDNPSITTAELKSEFDRAGFEIQKYINETMVPKINELDDASETGVKAGGVFPYHFNSATNAAISNQIAVAVSAEEQRANNAYLGARKHNASDIINDGTILTNAYGNGTVTEAKIADGAVTADKIANGSVLWNKLGIQVFENNAARDSAIPSPENGQIVLVKRG